MTNTVFVVPADLACPVHTSGCPRTFRFDLHVEFERTAAGPAFRITPDADTACLQLAGHLLREHELDCTTLAPAGIPQWANEQVWAAAHAASFDLGKGMRADGWDLDDDGHWRRSA